MKNFKSSPLFAWAMFVALACIWGSSFILMKRGLLSFSYSQIGALRITLAFLFTLVIAFKHFKFLTKSNWFPLFIVGVFGNGLPYILFPLAVTELDSSVVGILNSMVPLFTLLIGLVWFKLKVKWISVVGILLGFLGAAWLLMPGLQFEMNKLIYGAYPVVATVCYAVSINTINSKLSNLKPLSITLLSLLFVGVPSMVYLGFTDFISIMKTDQKAWLNFGYITVLGVVGSSLAIIIFNYLIQQTSSLFAASVTYAIPVVALLWGVWDGEQVGIHHAFGMLSILIGVYLVNKRGSLKERILRKQKEAG